jgi:ABC-2 type transport system permease protein
MPIIDQGYQHWSGELSGHSWRWLAVTRQGVRITMRNRFMRYVLFAAWVPALALVTVLSLWGLLERKSSMVSAFIGFMRFMNPGVIADPRYYRVEIWQLAYGYFLHAELFFAMILILVAGPGLISQDLRVNALPLYFSRPLRRIDYFLGKLGVIAAFLAMVLIVPAVVAYIVGLLFSLDIRVIPDTIGLLVAVVIYGVIITISAGTLVLALSALSRNSRYVALLWLGLWFVSSVVSSVLDGVHHQQIRYAYYAKLRDQKPQLFNHHYSQAQWRERWRAQQLMRQRVWEQYHAAHLRDSRTDWRPLVSYTANLNRLEDHLLGTNNAWRNLAKLEPGVAQRNRLLSRYMGPQFPWVWSAGVLAALFGLSVCLLSLSIRSLDRLK